MLLLEKAIRTPWKLLVTNVQIWIRRRLFMVGMTLGEINDCKNSACNYSNISNFLPLSCFTGLVMVGGSRKIPFECTAAEGGVNSRFDQSRRPSLVSPIFLKRWQHLADTLISVKAIPDEDKELAKLLTGYQDMLGLLSVHKVARINTQVPAILEATTFSMKLRKRRALVLECLNQAPVDGSSGSSYGTSGSCSGSSKTGNLDF